MEKSASQNFRMNLCALGIIILLLVEISASPCSVRYGAAAVKSIYMTPIVRIMWDLNTELAGPQPEDWVTRMLVEFVCALFLIILKKMQEIDAIKKAAKIFKSIQDTFPVKGVISIMRKLFSAVSLVPKFELVSFLILFVVFELNASHRYTQGNQIS